jgi:hypothetical protein
MWLWKYAASGKISGSILYEVIVYLQLASSFEPIVAQESTERLSEVSLRNVTGRKVRSSDNLTAICEPIV